MHVLCMQDAHLPGLLVGGHHDHAQELEAEINEIIGGGAMAHHHAAHGPPEQAEAAAHAQDLTIQHDGLRALDLRHMLTVRVTLSCAQLERLLLDEVALQGLTLQLPVLRCLRLARAPLTSTVATVNDGYTGPRCRFGVLPHRCA